MNFYRPATENDIRDRNGKKVWIKAGLDSLTQCVAGKIEVLVNHKYRKMLSIPLLIENKETGTKINVEQRCDFYADGSIKFNVDVRIPEEVETLAKVGCQMLLNESFNQTSWYGLGPVSTYSDRNSAGKFGYYNATAKELFDQNLVIPQENANRSGVFWGTITNIEGIGFFFDSDDEFNFSAYPYADDAIDKSRHANELDEANFVTLNLDHKQAGLGTATCGPGVLEQYLIDDNRYKFKFTLKPIDLSDQSIFEILDKN